MHRERERERERPIFLLFTEAATRTRSKVGANNKKIGHGRWSRIIRCVNDSSTRRSAHQAAADDKL